MSKPQLEAVLSLLTSVEAGDKSSPASAWLVDGSVPVDALDENQAMVAIEAARRMGLDGRLREATSAKLKPVRKAASRALHVLRSTGHQIAPAPKASGQWTMGEEAREVPEPVGLIGLPQADGYFPFIMLAYSKDGACVCAGVAGAGQGFQDSDHAHVGRSKARQVIANARRDHNLVEVPFHVALHLVERAFTEGGKGEPHGWGHMLSSVEEGVKNSARLLDPLAQQPASLDSSALQRPEALLEGTHRVVFSLDDSISGPAIDAVMGALTSKLALDDDEKRRRVADEVVAAVNAAFDGIARKNWVLAMDVLSVITEVAGRTEAQKAARAISLALTAGRPGADIPFFRIWTERQLAAVSEMILSVRADKEGAGQ
jgi:hypothetical protein